MKLFILVSILCISSYTPINSTTYEQMQQQLEQQANQKEATARDKFWAYYKPTVIFQLGTAILTGISTTLAIQAIKNNDTKLACLFSGLSALLGYGLLLKHSELTAAQADCNQAIYHADQIYNIQMKYIHKRHYQNDIAKFQMNRLEEICEKYFKFNDSNK